MFPVIHSGEEEDTETQTDAETDRQTETETGRDVNGERVTEGRIQ
jgi:hypothetical protein